MNKALIIIAIAIIILVVIIVGLLKINNTIKYTEFMGDIFEII